MTPHATLVILLASFAIGCSGGSDAGTAAGRDNGDGASNGSSGEALPEKIEFSPERIDFKPGERIAVTVRLAPPAVYTVRFALLGEPADGYLDQSLVSSNSQGEATVQLTAPSTETTFRIRASVGGAVSAELPVTADPTPTTTLTVVPQYESPARADRVERWVATAHPSMRCEDLAGTPPPDGPHRGEAPATDNPRIPGVPVGTPLAVTLRAGMFAGGCTDVEGLVEDGSSEVVVEAADRALQMDEAALRIELGIVPTTGWTAAVDATIADVSDAMVNPDGEAFTLLDTMAAAAATGSAAQLVEQETAQGDWLAVTQNALADGSFSSAAQQWMQTGSQRLEQPDAIVGALDTTNAADSTAMLALTSIASEEPTEAGFPATLEVTWAANPGDKVRLGATLFWTPSRLVTALARQPALAAAMDANDIADALGEHLDCQALGGALAAAATDTTLACDASCLTGLCRTALEVIWSRARKTLVEPVKLEIAASGIAVIDDAARPIGFEGSWVGTAELFGFDVSLEGPARGKPLE